MAKQVSRAEHGKSWREKQEEDERAGKPKKKYLEGVL